MEQPIMMNADDETTGLLEVLRRLGRSLVDQYVRGVTMQYRYLIDGPPQTDRPGAGEHQA
jgi:hypothetical protein